MTMSLIFSSLFSWIERKSTVKNYPIYLVLILVCVSLFFAFPRYDLYENTSPNWDVTMLKSKDLTNNLSHIAPDSFLAKKVFRLTVPVTIKLFHLNRIGVLAIQFVLGILFLLYAYKLTKRVFKDAVSATFLVAGLVFLYCGRTCFTELSYTWFDGWAYFFLLMALYNKNIFPVFLFATLAAWTDERAFIALPIVILFHQINSNKPHRFKFKGLIGLNPSSIAVIAAMGGYIGLRLFLASAYNMHTPKELANSGVLERNIIHTSFGFGAYTFLEGFWLLFPLLLFFAYKSKHYLFLILVLGSILLSTITALCVYDITRSGSYLFPILFVFIAYISNFIEVKDARGSLFVCMFFSFIFPPVNYVAFGDLNLWMEKPFVGVLYNLFFK
jgi:hypothetical protein